MLIEAPPLTHRFVVRYEDGTIFEQALDDRPVRPRADGTGSSFSDVDVDRVTACVLQRGNDDDPDKRLYVVELETGQFEINGCAFFIGPDRELPPGARRRLQYFRRMALERDTNAQTGAFVRLTTKRCYHLGYEVVQADGIVLPDSARTIEVGHEIFHH